MAWIDNLDVNIIIRTGDGVEYSPGWIPTDKTLEFNVATFEFINVEGTLVKRNKPKGIVHNLILIFQGEDHLEQSQAFEQSSRNRNPWTIIHPYYQEILVQPLSIKFDNTGYNISRVTVALQETISDEFPKAEISITDAINLQKIEVDELVVLSTPASSPGQIQSQADQIGFIETKYVDLAQTDDDLESLRSLVKKAQVDIVSGISEPATAMQSMIDLINYPALLQIPVRNRLDSLIDTFENLVNITDNIVLEKNGSALVSAMFQAASNPIEGDYDVNTDVLDISAEILAINDQFIQELDSRQSDRADEVGSYVPDFPSMNALDLLVNFSLSNLFQIAFNTRQERIYVLDEDSNPIVLCHRFYGMDEEDANLDEFINQNNLGPEEVFQIQKGREVRYYV